MSSSAFSQIAIIGIDVGKNSFHIVGLDKRGAIILRQKWSRGQVEARLANMPSCLIGMKACVSTHHLSRKLNSLGHDARLTPAKYVRPYSKGPKNDFRDAEAVQRPTMKFVGKTRLRVFVSIANRLGRDRKADTDAAGAGLAVAHDLGVQAPSPPAKATPFAVAIK